MNTTSEPATNGVVAHPLSPLDVLTLAQAAAYLQLPPDMIQAEATGRHLRGRRLGDEWRFVREDLVRWVRTDPVPPAIPDETEEEYQEFLATIARHRNETDRYHGCGKYAPE